MHKFLIEWTENQHLKIKAKMYTSCQKFISYHHFPDVLLHGSESSINIRKALIELLQHEKYNYM